MPMSIQGAFAYSSIPLYNPSLPSKILAQESSWNIRFCKVYDTIIFIGAGMYYLQQFSYTDFASIAQHLPDKLVVSA
jgi:hypothetical protein